MAGKDAFDVLSQIDSFDGHGGANSLNFFLKSCDAMMKIVKDTEKNNFTEKIGSKKFSADIFSAAITKILAKLVKRLSSVSNLFLATKHFIAIVKCFAAINKRFSAAAKILLKAKILFYDRKVHACG